MQGSQCRRPGWYHGLHGWWFVAGCSLFRFLFGYLWSQVLHHDWCCHLVSRNSPSLCFLASAYHLTRCIGCVLVCAVQNIPMLIVGRIINGFAVGICSAQVPVYITEIVCLSQLPRIINRPILTYFRRLPPPSVVVWSVSSSGPLPGVS